jgi:hypothetical protein
MNDRYAINIQNPIYSLEVFVWDREAKKVLFSTGYPELTIDAQQAAKDRCQRWLDDHTAMIAGHCEAPA